MTTTSFLLSTWHWDPVGAGLCGAAIAAAALLGWRTWGAASGSARGKLAFIGAGLIVLLLALLSPLATLARQYLFSAHMAQHILLLLVVPALALLGWPNKDLSKSRLTALDRLLGQSPVGWVAGVGAMWFWHAPRLCDAASANSGVYLLQAASLLILGTAFWWPIIGPSTNRRLSPLAGIAYLVTACFACTLLGIYVTFAPVGICPAFVHPADPAGVLPLIRNGWGMTPETDQAVGGLMMWVPGCLIYLSGVIGLLARWYNSAEAVQSPPIHGHASNV